MKRLFQTMYRRLKEMTVDLILNSQAKPKISIVKKTVEVGAAALFFKVWNVKIACVLIRFMSCFILELDQEKLIEEIIGKCLGHFIKMVLIKKPTLLSRKWMGIIAIILLLLRVTGFIKWAMQILSSDNANTP